MKRFVLLLGMLVILTTVLTASEMRTIKFNTKGYNGQVVVVIPAEVNTPSLDRKDFGFFTYTYKNKKNKKYGVVKRVDVRGQEIWFELQGNGTLYINMKTKKAGKVQVRMGKKTRGIKIGGMR